jgi:hypothetical protein
MLRSLRVRRFWSFALVAALLSAQWASQLHGFEHVRYELARAETTGTAGVGGQEKAPKLGHSIYRCLEIQAFDCVAVAKAIAVVASPPVFSPIVERGVAPRFATYLSFLARAPPVVG